MIIYEPMWAIESRLSPTIKSIVGIHQFIREYLVRIDSQNRLAKKIKILYGGIVKRDNAAALWAEPEIEGLLVDGSSLNVEELLSIFEAAEY